MSRTDFSNISNTKYILLTIYLLQLLSLKYKDDFASFIIDLNIIITHNIYLSAHDLKLTNFITLS